jgi:hypothetical protein
MAARKVARVAEIPTTTRLKLFRYPHKFGGGSSWCVGLERCGPSDPEGHHFVSQRFLSAWSEDHAVELARFGEWMQHLGCEGSKEDKHG